MAAPIIALVYDRNKRANAQKEGSIELRITLGKVQRYATTGIRVFPREFRNGIIVRRSDTEELQERLDMFVSVAQRTINNDLAHGCLDMDKIVSKINSAYLGDATANVQKKRLVADFFRERADIRKYGRAKDSQERYDRFIRWFSKWGVILTFDDITPANVIKMDEELSKSGMLPKSRWHNYHRFLNSFIIDAINEGIMKKNPYKSGIHIKKVSDKDGIHKYLTSEEFDRIVGLEPPTAFLCHARDLFVFQVRTCMAYVDMAAFDASRIRYVGGRPMYTSRRGKTSQEFSFLVMKQAMDVLDKYGGQLPMMSNQKYNDYLKVIAVMAGIDKPLSSHWARHTGATLMLNSGVNMEVVARILGHSSTKMTREVYAKLLDTTIVDEMSRYESSIGGL